MISEPKQRLYRRTYICKSKRQKVQTKINFNFELDDKIVAILYLFIFVIGVWANIIGQDNHLKSLIDIFVFVLKAYIIYRLYCDINPVN